MSGANARVVIQEQDGLEMMAYFMTSSDDLVAEKSVQVLANCALEGTYLLMQVAY